MNEADLCIYAALAKIVAEVQNVPKSGYNSKFNYHYVREGDMIDACKAAMLKHGVIRVPVEYRADGDAGRAHVTMTSKWIHLESGSSHEITIEGRDVNGQNKATWAAYTGALKYELRHLLFVATGDDPEQNEESSPSGDGLPEPAVSAMREMIEHGARLNEVCRDAAEFEFASKYLKKVHKYGADVKMSDRQLDWMRRIYTKLMDLVSVGEPANQGASRHAEEPMKPQTSTDPKPAEDPEDDLPF